MIGTMPIKPRMPIKRTISGHQDYASAELLPSRTKGQVASATNLQRPGSLSSVSLEGPISQNFKHTLLRHQLRRQKMLPPAGPDSGKKDKKRLPSALQPKTTLELFRNSVNSSHVEAEKHDPTLGLVQKEAERKTAAYHEMQEKLEIIKVANAEIARKKNIVNELKAKYPDIKIDPDYIISCTSEEVQRLVQLLLFDDRLAKAAVRIQS